MNCLDFHREKLADPRRLSLDAQAHADACSACAAFAAEVDETERSLQRALATPVPDGLAERIVLRSRGGAVRHWRLWALAASVLLGIAFGFAYLGDGGKPADQYARLAIEHVVMEPESFATERDPGPAAFAKVMESFGASLKEPLGRVRYVRLCPVEDGMGWHIVFETPDGLATLILVPDKPLRAEQTAAAGGWSALVRPVRRGYYAVVTADPAATSRVERMLRERVDWDA